MKLAIAGDGCLAETTRTCCAPHFTLVAPRDADLLWCCGDTPIDLHGVPDNALIVRRIMAVVETAAPLAPVLISSQVPVGTTAQLESLYPERTFAHSPENIRVASAVADFRDQSRIVVGRRSLRHDALFITLFAPFTKSLIWSDPETAELAKHALNAYLACMIAFANEVGRVAKLAGADMATITQALRTDRRVSPRAPLMAGAPFNSGHLERDLHTLTSLAARHGLALPLLASILPSNDGTRASLQQQ